MLASLWSWIAPTPSSSEAKDAPRRDDPQPLPANTKRNRKKRQQHKKKKLQQQAQRGAHTEDGDDQDEREPDELLWHDDERRRALDHYPDADQDESYLGALDHDDDDEPAVARDEASSTRIPQRSPPPTTPSPPTGGGAATLTPHSGGVPPESLAVDDLVASMLAQGKTHPGPSGPLHRVHNLPEGAGQAPGLPLVRSTAESRRKAIEHGLVPITDEHGTLRVGFRIRDDIVLMHPKDLKGEPVLLRM